jgi:L-Ala-D/L-Glu epimerase
VITASLHHLEIPFQRAFGHALATRDRAEAIVLVLNDGDGDDNSALGVGECVPRAYVTGETFASVWDAIVELELAELWERVDRSSPAQLVRSVERLQLPARLRGPGGGQPLGLAAACAVELALLDLACRKSGWRLAELAFALGLPPALLSREPLPEIPSVPLDFTRQPGELASLVGSKLGHLKVKVGGERASDVRRLRECRELFGATFSISVDANMAWSFDEALRAAEAFAPFELAWFEEPLRQSERARYPELRQRGGIAVMLDEAACGLEQTKAALSAGACDLLNIRISKCGGFLASLRLIELAAAAGVRCQHGAQVGQLGFLNAAGRHFTSTVRGLVACEGGPGLANLCDFPTQTRLELDWTAGHLVGLSGPGLGAAPDLAKLRRYATRSITWNGGRWC